MQASAAQSSGFRGEFLWELSIPQTQLLALADAVPGESFGWRPAEDARPFSAVLIHIAMGNLMLLYLIDVRTPEVIDLYGLLEGSPMSQLVALNRKNVAMEKTVTEKAAVIDVLKQSFEAVAASFTTATDDELENTRQFFGQLPTTRRMYLRMLAHSHEHMGQAIAYARCMGFKVPWPDPLRQQERAAAGDSSH